MKKLGTFILLIGLLIACGEAPTTGLDPIEPLPENGGDVDSLSQAEEDASPTLTPPPDQPESGNGGEETAVTEETQPVESGENGTTEEESGGEETAVTEEATEEADPAPETGAVAVSTTEPIEEEEMVEVVEEFESQLDEQLKAQTGSDLSFGGFETVETRAISLADGSELFVSYSVGFRPFDPIQNHFVLLAQPAGDGWIELGRVELEVPDILFPESVTTLEENGRLWLQVESGVGAHSGCYDALLWDGITFTSTISHCHSSPGGAGRLDDFNEDGQIDLLLNNTNDYIFCYACSVRLPSYQMGTFNGSAWETVTLSSIESGDETVVALNNEAVSLANAGLWQDASLTLSEISSDDPAVIWNQTIVGLYEEAHLDMLSFSPYPFLQSVFYGDYESAISMMRGFDVQALFTVDKNPMIVGTPAEGWLDPLAEWLIVSTDLALAEQPELAEAHFIRGWATYLVDPQNPAILMDIQQAATLAPTDPLYVDSLLLISGE